MRSRFLSAAFFFCFAISCLAHEGIHEQIEQVTKEIAGNPKDANLYLRRGELFRFHGEVKRALADYASAERLNPQLDAVDLCRGHLYYDRNEYTLAEKYFVRFLAKHPENVDGLLTRARLFAAMKKYQQAVQDYTEAIRLTAEPTPEFYIEKANALSAQGEAHRQQAIATLNEGVAKLGPIVTLQLPAIDLDVQAKNYDSALQRIDSLMAQSDRKESWLFRRGEILQKADRTAEAQAEFKKALSEIESLPSYLKETRATRELESEIRRAMNK